MADEPARGGASVDEAGGDVGDAGAGPSESDPVGKACRGQPVTRAEIQEGRVLGDSAVSLTGLVASSQKFLVSEAKSGSCLWGAFVAFAGAGGPGSGLLLVSFGPAHEDGTACEPGMDGIPDELSPGDAVEVEGYLDEFAPQGCKAVVPARQLRVDASCPIRRLGKRAAPPPTLIDVALADSLSAGNDTSLLGDWGGVLVQLEAVTAQQDPDDGDGVFPFGVVRLNETKLEVRSRLYYFDLTEGGPRSSAKAPRYGHPTQFASVTGVLMLDYCTWVLAPRDRCLDAPTGAGCAGQAAGP